MIEGLDTPRARIAALTGFVQDQIRYVSVQMGIGGYRPFPPHETLASRWGDCKAKSFLLLDLLAEAGVEALPVLIRSDADASVDPSFPSHTVFNHLIVAVPVGQLEVQEGDPVAHGYLFLDPTLSRGRGAWLHPATQDQEALVVLPSGGILVRTPVRVGSEASRVEVNLTVQADGSGSGSVRWQWSGEGANALLEALAVRGRVRVEASVLSALGGFLPGAQLGAVAIHEDEGALPRLRIEGAFTLRQAVQGTGERRSLLVPQQPSLPSPWTLEDRAVPVVVEPVQEEVVWTIQVPAEWCLPAAEDEQVVNAVGSYRRRLDAGPSQLVLRRSLELGKRVVAVTEVPALRELAVAEQRGNQRRVRFGCQPGVTPAE